MKLRIMLIMLLLAMSAALATPATAAILQTADPDGLPVLTELTNQFEGVTLSVLELGEPSDSVVAAFDYNVSTGDRSFGWIGPGSPPISGGNFDQAFQLRADFDEPTDFVAIDAFTGVVQLEAGPPMTATSNFSAYDSLGNLLDGSSLTWTSEMKYTTQTHELSRATADISYIVLAGSEQNQNFNYDNLRFNIPEPASFLMFAPFAVLLTRRRRCAS